MLHPKKVSSIANKLPTMILFLLVQVSSTMYIPKSQL